MADKNDNDIKIFSPASQEPESDELSAIEELKRQIGNGNLEKGKKLGKALAERFVLTACVPGDYSYLGDYCGKCSDDVIYHVKELAVFLVLSKLSAALSSQSLSAAAVNSFYDELIKSDPEFFEKVSSGTAFSFYYLDAKNTINVPERIGNTFAMLCGDENSETFYSLGTDAYKTASREIEKIIEGFDFA